MRHDLGHLSDVLYDVGGANPQQHAIGWALHQAPSCRDADEAGSFRAHEGASNVKAVFREQEVEVITGDAAGNVWITVADEVAIAISDVLQLRVDLASASAATNDLVEFLRAGRADLHAQAVVS